PCARRLARRAQGGLILVDADEGGLEAAADAIETPPERVSTLAFDVADSERWTQAVNFIRGQYGRLDYAIVDASAAHSEITITEGDLVTWTNNGQGHVRLTLAALTELMGANAQGGSIVVLGLAGAGDTLRDAARVGVSSSVRVNAVNLGVAPIWRNAPLFQDIVRDEGDERRAYKTLLTLPNALARFEGDIFHLISQLLSDDCPASGATLVVDGGYAL
ncbi:MAG TPA: SDR family oxidoreductase, partial [Verrucomicrobiae bacterium]|nr:SDR family oxidoreductase [Verrucomicrobiae bacterium]